MGEGLFILLCVLALIIGTRARNSKVQNPKSLAKKKKIKKALSYVALVLIGLLLIVFTPSFFKGIRIALDTRFSIENYLGIGVILVGSFTFISILKKLKTE